MRAKTLFFIALLPALIILGLLQGARVALLFACFIAACSVLAALRGLCRDRAYKFFPVYVILYAPVWVLERMLSTYWALYWRVAHGGYPFGDRLLSKGTGRAWVAGARVQRRRAG
jgi:multisubunit Na+/H+ antiporter MnhE subunit